MTNAPKPFRIRQGAKVLGPFSRHEVIALLRQGRLFGSDLAKTAGGNWRPLTEVLEREVSQQEAETIASPRVLMTKRADGSPRPEPPVRSAYPVSGAVDNVEANVADQPGRNDRKPVLQPNPRVHAPMDNAALQPRTLTVSLSALLVFAVVFSTVLVGGALVLLRLTETNTTVAKADEPIENAAPVEADNLEVGEMAVEPLPAASSPEPETEQQTPAPPAAPSETKGNSPDVVPPQPPAEQLVMQTSDLKSVALLCFTEKNDELQKMYIPHMTVWAVDGHHFAGRGIRLLSAAQLLKEKEFSLHALTADRIYTVKEIRFHPDFPADKIGRENTDAVLEKLFLNDVALLEVEEELISPPLTLAKSPNLVEEKSTTPLRYLSVPGITDEEEFALDYKPAVSPIELSLRRHVLAPRGDSRFAGVQSENFRLVHDGSPIIDSRGQVIGLLSLTHGPDGLVQQGPHQLLSVERVREVLASSPD